MSTSLLEAPVKSSPVRVRRLGMHGARNAGKTCYLGCLYGFRALDGADLTCRDSDTVNYLAEVWNFLARQKLPPATAMGLPTDLAFDVGSAADRQQWPVQLADYAGALVQAVPRQAAPLARELTQDVRGWFRACHALLLFLDSQQPDLEQLDALDLLLTELRRPHGNGYTLERPVGLVLTKWDSQGPISDDPAQEEERARAYLESNRVFNQLVQKLRDCGDRLKVFPVSAFGGHARNNQPPPADLWAPFNLHAPLLWAARLADEVLLDEARQEAQRHLDRSWRVLGLPLLRWPDHEAARRHLESLKADYALVRGPVAEHLTEEIQTLRVQKVKWLGVSVARALAAVVLVAGLVGLYGWRVAEQEFGALDRFRRDHPGRDDAGRRLEHGDRYLASWWTYVVPPRRASAAGWREADAALVAEQQALALARERGRSLEDDARLAEAIALYRAFLADYPDSPGKADVENRLLALVPVFEDQEEFDKLRQAASRGNRAAALTQAHALAQDYLAAPRAVKRMRDDVLRWKAWFDRLPQENAYHFVVESLTIPKGSDLVRLLGTTPRVVLEMNGVKHETGWYKGNTPTVNEKLGPFPYRWGQPAALKVRVESHHNILPNDAAEVVLRDDRFLPALAHGPVGVPCKNGKSVTVYLSCPDAVPPELPPYRSR